MFAAVASLIGVAQQATRLVDIGGWRLRLNCAGDASPGVPSVILEAGGGDTSSTWSPVQARVAAFARVCSYDRAGSGGSDAGPRPRTMRQMVYELHELLVRANIAPPYVLVGHSLGGFLVRIYTNAHPDDVSGIVLVDASHEDDLVGMNGTLRRWWQRATGAPIPPAKASLTQDEPGPSQFDGDEAAALRAERAANPQPLGGRPLIVLTRGISGYDGEPLAEQRDQERRLHQADLVSLSRNGRQVIAEGSRHAIQADAPDLVVQAIRDVLSSR